MAALQGDSKGMRSYIPEGAKCTTMQVLFMTESLFCPPIPQAPQSDAKLETDRLKSPPLPYRSLFEAGDTVRVSIGCPIAAPD